MRYIGIAFALAALLFTAGCANKFRSYDGPEVTRVTVHKDARRMFLWHHDRPLAGYEIDLGFAPEGHKQFEGDGRTPEGRYVIDRRNPNSNFHLSIGISYPNENDRAFARKSGKDPGGDIFIHGKGQWRRAANSPDWTAGCIAVTNREIEEIYAMVRNGTVIDIYP